jgi:plastocyanin
MRTNAIAVLLAATVALTACGGGHTAKTAATSSAIEIAGFKFKPATVTVSTGSTLRFVNRDRAEHTATLPAGFDTGPLRSGQSKAVVLRKPGTFVYRCDFHPFMTGEVVVK